MPMNIYITIIIQEGREENTVNCSKYKFSARLTIFDYVSEYNMTMIYFLNH